MSSWSSLPGITLPACALSAALLLPPGEASAQRPPEQKNQSLSAAIAEAKRSPFWAVSHTVPLQAAGNPVPVGSARLSRQENSQAGQPNDGPRHLGFVTILGIAAGDFIGFSVCDNIWCVGLVSSPVTVATTLIAGAPPGPALLGSLLGTGLGMGTGYLVGRALVEPLYMAAVIPAAITYYAVRLGVTLTTIRRLGRDD